MLEFGNAGILGYWDTGILELKTMLGDGRGKRLVRGRCWVKVAS